MITASGRRRSIELADDHLLRRRDHRCVVEAEQDHVAEVAVLESRATLSLVQPHRPGDARHAADAIADRYRAAPALRRCSGPCSSITQMSASRTSGIWLAVRRMMPMKIDTCCDISSVANATPKIRPKYLPDHPSTFGGQSNSCLDLRIVERAVRLPDRYRESTLRSSRGPCPAPASTAPRDPCRGAK